MSYQQARADFEYLESVAEVEDMVAMDADVWSLMRDPTKRRAEEMYLCSIRLWMAEHSANYADALDVCEIADRHGIDMETPA